MKKINVRYFLLLPFSALYSLVTDIRNILFDRGFLKSESFSVPVISVGNLAVGGTGKTPHVEYFLSVFGQKYKCAVLSRGYKRHTRGYFEAGGLSSFRQTGDEPAQISNKFVNTVVAVCENRVVGIHEILHRHPDVELILLDDAFQHRYVKPTISILLTSYFRLFSDDFVLPGGNLRECRKNYRRADIIIVTKCPENTGEDEMTAIRKKIKPAEHQKLYFSAYEYAEIIPAFEAKAHYTTDDIKINNPTLLLVTGIAGAGEPLKKLREMSDKTELLSFPDHHDFSKNDILKIEEKFKCLAGKDKMIITTEKDVIRLRENIYIPEYLKRNIFYLLIKVKILDNKDDILIKTITENVGKN